MDLGHAIDGVGAHDAQVGHVDPLLPTLLNERHATQTILIARKLSSNSLHSRNESFALLALSSARHVGIFKKKNRIKINACNARH